MKVSRAIELLTDYQKRRAINRKDDVQDALLLGLDALRRVQYCRIGRSSAIFDSLPGETPEEKVKHE